jgi:N6-adenosine-specific RNA methylase IME4
MDRAGRVNGPYKRLQIRKQSQQLRAFDPPLPMHGPYRCIVVDYPWPYEPDDDDPGLRGRAMRPYPTMSIAKGRQLPLGSILAPDAVVWMWVTNFHMRYAYDLLDAWGLTATPTILTWVKDGMGRGQILRDKTEHCIVATGGKPTFDLDNETTELRAPRREHSRKPDEFYALVEKLCPAPRYAELFSRGERGPNWECHGDEIGRFATAPPGQHDASAAPDLKARDSDPSVPGIAWGREQDSYPIAAAPDDGSGNEGAPRWSFGPSALANLCPCRMRS